MALNSSELEVVCARLQALEYINKQGGLPIAARYLARAVALPPSNTSWYMGLSNGAAGLCESLKIFRLLFPPMNISKRRTIW